VIDSIPSSWSANRKLAGNGVRRQRERVARHPASMYEEKRKRQKPAQTSPAENPSG
jgi:hypothetical protein